MVQRDGFFFLLSLLTLGIVYSYKFKWTLLTLLPELNGDEVADKTAVLPMETNGESGLATFALS